MCIFCLSCLPSLPRFSYLCCLYRAALIKHGVGGGTESSSRAEEKGSNSSSQDGTLTYNGPAVLSAPHRVPTESPLLRQLFNRPPLTTHFQLHTYKHTCIGTHKLTCTYATHKHTHTHTQATGPLCVCRLCCSSHCFGLFEVLLRPNDSLFTFHIMQGRKS